MIQKKGKLAGIATCAIAMAIAVCMLLRDAHSASGAETPTSEQPPAVRKMMEDMALARDAFRGIVDVYLDPADLKAGKPGIAGVEAVRVYHLGSEALVQFQNAAGEQWLVNARYIVAAQTSKPRGR